MTLNTCHEHLEKLKNIPVREPQVILLTFSRGKSILLLNCPLDAQYNNSECCSAQFFL